MALQLLARARDDFALRSTRQAYELKVRFTVDSGGETNYDGAWEMEDLFGRGRDTVGRPPPRQDIPSPRSQPPVRSMRTAPPTPFPSDCWKRVEFYSIRCNPRPLPDRGNIRTSTAAFHGTTVTCLLLSRSRNIATLAPGRDWEEAEECIDPQSGLLQVHSEVPGRYAVYDYSNAPQHGGLMLPRSVMITEGGRIVSKISVESLRGITAADPDLFVPTDAMKARGSVVEMTSATKISRVQGEDPFDRSHDAASGLRIWHGDSNGTSGRGACVTAVRPEQSSGCGRRKEDRLLSDDAGWSAGAAAFCIRDREVCFPAISQRSRLAPRAALTNVRRQGNCGGIIRIIR